MINWKNTMLILLALLASFSFADTRRESLLNVKSSAISYAKEQIGVRYLFGGTDPKRGFDCSGLIQYVYQNAGIETPRDTRQRQSPAISSFLSLLVHKYLMRVFISGIIR